MDELARQLERPGDKAHCPGVFVMRDGQVLVGLRHYAKHGIAATDLWTIPGGRCEEGETIGRAVRREAAEEAGLTELELTDWLAEIPGARAGDIVPLFIGRSSQPPRLMEPEKFAEWRWCDPAAVPQPFINPEALILLQAWVRSHPQN